MSEEEAEEKPFYVDRARSGRAGCKKCKLKIDTGSLRLAKVATNPFGSGKVKMWHHVACMFEVFKKQRATTARINSPEDIGNWENMSEEDQEEILAHLSKQPGPAKTPEKKKKTGVEKQATEQAASKQASPSREMDKETHKAHKDNSFREFRRLCADIANEPSYTGKTAIVRKTFTEGSDRTGFKGDLLLWCRMLLPGAIKRVYNLQSKQLVKLFSRIFKTDLDAMVTDLEQGDVAETIRVFFEVSRGVRPANKSALTLPEVDEFLSRLADMTKEEEQGSHFETLAKSCSANDLKMVVRLVKHDLRINAGPKHILEAVHPDAYTAFQASRDLASVLARVREGGEAMQATVTLMTPIQPMLAEPCRSIEQALNKCPRGMYAEIKYDGERVQLHKQGQEFRYYSRSLKPVMPHKVAHLKDYIPQAFPRGNDLILDAEILLIDTTTGLPLPFGTLGVHKRAAFARANVCLFVFDCLYYNGRLLIGRSAAERRRILEENMTQIDNRVMMSETKTLGSAKELETAIADVFRRGLEGLVLKDVGGAYEPGKRHWLKVKKDYLFGGSMADSVDLVVLGAWYGTGTKGGMMSSFLMGVRDGECGDRWLTVTKVHGGHDDATLLALQTELDMVKCVEPPTWLVANKPMVPDLIAKDPRSMPVWEISGAEFTRHELHTARGISVRFPRVTKVRPDKDWRSATTLEELGRLYDKSKETADFVLPEGWAGGGSPAPSPSPSPSKGGKRQLKLSEGWSGGDKTPPSPSKTPPSKTSSSKTTPASKEKETKERGQQKLHFDSPPSKKRKENGAESSSSKKRDNRDKSSSNKKRESESSASKKRENGSESSSNKKRDKVSKSPANKKQESKSSANERARLAQGPRCPLPDFLQGIRALLPSKARDRASLERYLVAYGGVPLPPHHTSRSTHVLYAGGECEEGAWPSGAAHVHIDWLWDSIKLRSLQQVGPYGV